MAKKYNVFLISAFLLLVLMLIKFSDEQNKIHYEIGVYYVVCNNQTFNQNWEKQVSRGMAYAIPRLNVFFFNARWSYELVAEIDIDYEITGFDEYRNLPTNLDETFIFVSKYEQYDVVIVLFAGDFYGAYVINYNPVVYASEDMFKSENAYTMIIEHEVLHTFGIGDHNSPHQEKYYRFCIMGNVDLGRIRLCPECQEELVIP